MATLRDVTEDRISLCDAGTGVRLGDDPSLYSIEREIEMDGTVYYAVRGPSGDLDVVSGDHSDRVYRDVLTTSDGLADWVRENFSR